MAMTEGPRVPAPALRRRAKCEPFAALRRPPDGWRRAVGAGRADARVCRWRSG